MYTNSSECCVPHTCEYNEETRPGAKASSFCSYVSPVRMRAPLRNAAVGQTNLYTLSGTVTYVAHTGFDFLQPCATMWPGKAEHR